MTVLQLVYLAVGLLAADAVLLLLIGTLLAVGLVRRRKRWRLTR